MKQEKAEKSIVYNIHYTYMGQVDFAKKGIDDLILDREGQISFILNF